MAFTFSSEALTRPLAQFGQDSAQMILQTGAVIQQGLQQMMTSRQVQAMGTELGQLNPASPEWAQQAVQLGSRYPLAMKSPAGQFMLSTQAKAHAEWSQAQQATQQADVMMRRQIGMENLRTENDIRLEGIKQRNRVELGGGGVDLSGMDLAELPAAEEEVAPAPVMGTRLGGGMPRLYESEAPQPEAAGMSGLLPTISSDLAGLAAAQKATGMKPTRAQVASAIASGQSRRQQEKMLAERTAIAEKKAAESATVKKQSDVVENRLRLVRARINDFRADLAAFIKANEDKEREPKKEHDAYFKQKAEMQAALQKLGEEENSLMQQFEGNVAAPVAAAARPVLKYDPKSRSFK